MLEISRKTELEKIFDPMNIVIEKTGLFYYNNYVFLIPDKF